jgi:nitrite reductase (NADH) small subunit
MAAAARKRREVSLGPVERIPPGEGRAFVVVGQRIAVFRPRAGGVFATQFDCPHEGGPLAEGVTGACQVICPLHGWKFDLATGDCLSNPGHPLRTYAVRLADGQILVTAGGEPDGA